MNSTTKKITNIPEMIFKNGLHLIIPPNSSVKLSSDILISNPSPYAIRIIFDERSESISAKLDQYRQRLEENK